MKKKLALVAAATILVLAGCSAGTETVETPIDSQSTVTPESSQSSEVAPQSSKATEPVAEPTESDLESIAAGFEAPEPGTDAAIAWEALMGVDGEYAAYASYQAVIDEFGDVQPYLNIREAEGRHSDALIRQLNRYGYEAPANPYLGAIPAPADLTTAANAWAEGEVLNIEMYDELIPQTTDPKLIRVLNNLRAASAESHLPMFETAAANGGTLTQEQMAEMKRG